jgi:hypothetical protein
MPIRLMPRCGACSHGVRRCWWCWPRCAWHGLVGTGAAGRYHAGALRGSEGHRYPAAVPWRAAAGKPGRTPCLPHGVAGHVPCAIPGPGPVARGGARVAAAVRRSPGQPLADRVWSRRWNLAFVEMDRLLFVPLLRRVGPMGSLIGVFVISGLLHELAISFPAGAGWGLPSCYFLLQGVLVTLERHLLRPQRWPGALARMWAWSWLLVPLPLLFHTPSARRWWFRCSTGCTRCCGGARPRPGGAGDVD